MSVCRKPQQAQIKFFFYDFCLSDGIFIDNRSLWPILKKFCCKCRDFQSIDVFENGFRMHVSKLKTGREFENFDDSGLFVRSKGPLQGLFYQESAEGFQIEGKTWLDTNVREESQNPNDVSIIYESDISSPPLLNFPDTEDEVCVILLSTSPPAEYEPLNRSGTESESDIPTIVWSDYETSSCCFPEYSDELNPENRESEGSMILFEDSYLSLLSPVSSPRKSGNEESFDGSFESNDLEKSWLVISEFPNKYIARDETLEGKFDHDETCVSPEMHGSKNLRREPSGVSRVRTDDVPFCTRLLEENFSQKLNDLDFEFHLGNSEEKVEQSPPRSVFQKKRRRMNKKRKGSNFPNQSQKEMVRKRRSTRITRKPERLLF